MKNVVFRVFSFSIGAIVVLLAIAANLRGTGMQGSIAAAEHAQAMQARVAAQEMRQTYGERPRWQSQEYQPVATWEPPQAEYDWRANYQDYQEVRSIYADPRVVYEGDTRHRDALRERMEERRDRQEFERLSRQLDDRLNGN